MTTLDTHKNDTAAVLAQQRYTYPESLPDYGPVMEWIITMMQPMDAALALILAPGSRWSVAPDMLIGKDSELYILRGLLTQWDSQVWFIRQFEKKEREHIEQGTRLLFVQYLVWARNLIELADMELKINEAIAAFSA